MYKNNVCTKKTPLCDRWVCTDVLSQGSEAQGHCCHVRSDCSMCFIFLGNKISTW